MTAAVRAAVDQISTIRSGSLPTDHSTAGFTAPSLRDVLELPRELGEVHSGQGFHEGGRGGRDVHDASYELGRSPLAPDDELPGRLQRLRGVRDDLGQLLDDQLRDRGTAVLLPGFCLRPHGLGLGDPGRLYRIHQSFSYEYGVIILLRPIQPALL